MTRRIKGGGSLDWVAGVEVGSADQVVLEFNGNCVLEIWDFWTAFLLYTMT